MRSIAKTSQLKYLPILLERVLMSAFRVIFDTRFEANGAALAHLITKE
jgi:hypothetical protein